MCAASRAGRFIVFDGIEGVGKSTQLALTAAWLSAQGKRVVTTREPGGTPLGESLRSLLLDDSIDKVCEDAELLLMFAARAQHIATVIRPALMRGDIVLCDRFTDASYAYQGGGRGIPCERIEVLERLVHPDIKPDLVVILDASPQDAMRRLNERANRDRIEREAFEFFERVRDVYLHRAHAHPSRYLVVDAMDSIDRIQTEVANKLRDVCPS